MDSGILTAALAVSLALNVYLLLFIARQSKKDQPYSATTCSKCGYDTRATIDGKCPECGEPVIDRSSQDIRAITRCSFCGRSNRATGRQVEGPGGFHVCVPCIDYCHDVLLKDRDKKSTDFDNAVKVPPVPSPAEWVREDSAVGGTGGT